MPTGPTRHISVHRLWLRFPPENIACFFADAERHLQAARELADDDPSQRDRLDDLLRMTSGFRAYERGAVGEAERHWDAIRDPAVRNAVDRARGPMDSGASGVAHGGAR